MDISEVVELKNRISLYNSLDVEKKRVLLPITISLTSTMLNLLDLNQMVSKHPTDQKVVRMLLEVLEDFQQPEFKSHIAILKSSIEYMKYN